MTPNSTSEIRVKLHRPLIVGPQRIEVLTLGKPNAAALKAAQARPFPADDFDAMLLAISLATGIDEATLDRQLSARDYWLLSQRDYSEAIAQFVEAR